MAVYLQSFCDVLFVQDDIAKKVDLLSGLIIGISPLVHLLLVSGINAPYGRYASASWGPPIEGRLAWFLQVKQMISNTISSMIAKC